MVEMRVIGLAMLMVWTCGVAGCATALPRAARAPAAMPVQMSPGGPEERGSVARHRSQSPSGPPGLAGLLAHVPPTMIRHVAPRSFDYTDVVAPPRPRTLPPQTSMSDALGAVAGYYSLLALAKGVNLMVNGARAGATIMVAGVKAMVGSLVIAFRRSTSFIVLHQLFRNPGLARSYVLTVGGGRSATMTWTLVRRIAAGTVWQLDVSNASQSYRVLGLVRSVDGAFVYRIDVVEDLKGMPGESTEATIARLMSPGPMTPSTSKHFQGSAGASSIDATLDSGRGYVQARIGGAMSAALKLPLPAEPLASMCNAGVVPTLRWTTPYGFGFLRQTYLCGGGPLKDIRVQQLSPTGRIQMTMSASPGDVARK